MVGFESPGIDLPWRRSVLYLHNFMFVVFSFASLNINCLNMVSQKQLTNFAVIDRMGTQLELRTVTRVHILAPATALQYY